MRSKWIKRAVLTSAAMLSWVAVSIWFSPSAHAKSSQERVVITPDKLNGQGYTVAL